MLTFKKFKFLSLIFFSLLLFLSQNSCKSKQDEIKQSLAGSIKPVSETQIDSFSITISNGGGFTGLKNGYTFNSSGIVKRWRQISPVKDTTIWKVKTDGIKANQFRTQLVNSGILNKKYKGTGNITFVLTYKVPDTTYIWTWDGANGGKKAPIEIRDWFNKITDFIISARPKK